VVADRLLNKLRWLAENFDCGDPSPSPNHVIPSAARNLALILWPAICLETE
jgi:hypothetical protein